MLAVKGKLAVLLPFDLQLLPVLPRLSAILCFQCITSRACKGDRILWPSQVTGHSQSHTELMSPVFECIKSQYNINMYIKIFFVYVYLCI